MPNSLRRSKGELRTSTPGAGQFHAPLEMKRPREHRGAMPECSRGLSGAIPPVTSVGWFAPRRGARGAASAILRPLRGRDQRDSEPGVSSRSSTPGYLLVALRAATSELLQLAKNKDDPNYTN